MTRGRIGLVYPHSNLDSVPCLVGTVEALARAGYDVDVLVTTRPGEVPVFSSPRVRVVSIGTEASALPPAALRGRLRFLPRGARASLARSYTLARRLRPRPRAAPVPDSYDALIGVDPDGLIMAHELGRGAPIVYFSLELLLSADVRTDEEHRLKERERALSQQAALVVIQDEARGRLLAEDNAIPLARMAFVPNSPPGPARRTPNRYWHARFGLPADARVVLHAGSLGAWTGIEYIVASAASWPQPWVLVVHTRYDAESSPYVERLRAQADPRRVSFSLKPVPRHEYDALIDGADVGIAFYVPSRESAFTQRNIQVIGLSSGKLAYVLRAGLPVITNAAISIAPRLTEAGCGVAVEDAGAIGPALARIATHYDDYSTAACRFFDAELNFERAFETVIERLEGLRVAA